MKLQAYCLVVLLLFVSCSGYKWIVVEDNNIENSFFANYHCYLNSKEHKVQLYNLRKTEKGLVAEVNDPALIQSFKKERRSILLIHTQDYKITKFKDSTYKFFVPNENIDKITYGEHNSTIATERTVMAVIVGLLVFVGIPAMSLSNINFSPY